AAVIGRTLEALGLRVAIVPQPDWRGDYRDFKKLGTPRFFFGVSPGAMDSMINHYTANKRLRSDDAYTPDRRAGMRPDYPSIVYTKILKELYPDVPVVLGGIEASLRRLSHYDYWQDRLRPGILADSPADLLIYGMGELPMKELVTRLQAGESFNSLKDIRQTVYLTGKEEIKPDDIVLFSHEECLRDKLKQAKNFRHIEEESNKYNASRILQQVGKQTIVVNPPFPPMTEAEVDASFDLPYTRLPHPKYKGKVIPAFEMIKFSVNMHRGCFGGCAFCTISAHQGKFIASRSKESILKEVKAITEMPDFKGYLSDLGGPSANMYRMKGKDQSICAKCKKPSCISPVICKNLNADHTPLLDIYKAVDSMPQIKRSFIGSGVRYDLLLHRYDDEIVNKSAQSYTEELIARHVSGRLKVAPEHTEDNVLKMMRKPSFDQFGQFKKIFDRINKQQGLNQQLIPYFISSHPGCTEEDMAKLAIETKKLHFQLEQVQDFTPTPMTLATEIYYTGYHPYTLEKVYTARTKEQKLAQRQFFFWYKPEFRRQITQALQKIGKKDLLTKLFGR
ncbi:YgiQ family radical SAM protein, partial [Parabacteroides goldsteinii]